jgi:diguanylate cyclase (GGDEF)-like protein
VTATPSRPVRSYIVGIVLAGVLTVLFAIFRARSVGIGPAPEFIAITVLLGLNWSFPLLLPKASGVEALQLDEAFLVTMALLLSPYGTILSFAIGVTAGQIARRRALDKGAFNFGQMVVSVGLAELVIGGLGHFLGDGVTPTKVAVVVLGAVVFSVANQAAVARIISLTGGVPFPRVFADGLSVRLFVWASSVSIGVLAGLTADRFRWGLGFAVLPMVVLQVVASRHVRARHDNDRLDGLFRAAVEAHAPTRLSDVEGAITAAAERLLGSKEVRIDDDGPGVEELGVRLLGDAGPERWLIVSRRSDVRRLRDDDERMLEAVAAIGTAAIEKTALLEQVKRQAFHDALTDLPNQLLFDYRVHQALSHAQRSGDSLAVAFLDLDNFKKVNDSLGHAMGNELLQQVARRLAGAVREGDTVARMGGDEFTILLTGIQRPDDAMRVADNLLRAIASRPFRLDRHELVLTASIGIALSPRDGSTPQTLLKNADAAMYHAKARGRAGYQLYDADMNAMSYARLALEADLHNALRSSQLRVLYQPLIDLRTGVIAGVEALVRWDHPDLGLLGPDQFVPIAEQVGLIEPVDSWVLRSACAQGSAWVEAGLPSIRVGVNVSAMHLKDARLVGMVRHALATTGFDPRNLEIELTESAAVGEGADTLPTLEAIRALGVHIAIDDFGVGYSMLGRLREFPIDTLKIDKSFVQEITDVGRQSPLVAAIVAMGHSLDLRVVAEGVETTSQLAFLEELHCDLGQGFLFSHPLRCEGVEGLLLDRMTQDAATIDIRTKRPTLAS